MTKTVTQGVLLMHSQYDPANRLRLLEAWLPLAQAMNSEFSWHLQAETLEQIVLHAAANLARVTALADARAVLYYAYAQVRGETQ